MKWLQVDVGEHRMKCGENLRWNDEQGRVVIFTLKDRSTTFTYLLVSGFTRGGRGVEPA